MEQTLLKPGGVGGDWKVIFVVWLVLVGIVFVVTDFGLPGIVVGMGGLYFVYRGVMAVRQALASRSVEREPIGSLADRAGAVEVEGTAKPAEETVTAPLTGTESVAYRVQVFQYESTPSGE